jgi:hypothetical protein
MDKAIIQFADSSGITIADVVFTMVDTLPIKEW